MQTSNLYQRPHAKYRHAQCQHHHHHHQQQQQLLLVQLPSLCRCHRRVSPRASSSCGDSQSASTSSSVSSSSSSGSSSSSSNNSSKNGSNSKRRSKFQQATGDQARPVPATSQSTVQDVLRTATSQLQSSIGLLKDAAAAAFVPDYRPSSTQNSSSDINPRSMRSTKSSSSAGDGRTGARFRSYSSLVAAAAAETRSTAGVDSISARLERILTGRFIREAQGNSSGRKDSKQPFDAKLAAIQFELQKVEAAQQQQPQPQQEQSPANGAIIDVVPDVAAVTEHQVGAPMNYAAAGPNTATLGTGSSTAAVEVDYDAKVDTFPATTQMLVIVTWAIFLLQWWPALPQLWHTAMHSGILQAATTFLFAYPDTPMTQALCLVLMLAKVVCYVVGGIVAQNWVKGFMHGVVDSTKLQAGNLSGLLTSGFLHSGLAATWLYTRALLDSARWIEVGMGSMELLATYAVTAFCASFAHLVGGTTMVGVGGAGAVLGIYTMWSILALQYLKEDLPEGGVYANMGLVVLLSIGLSIVQPAIGMASVVGGVMGGVVAVKIAHTLAKTLTWGVAVPFLALLFALRIAVEGVKVLMLAMVPLVVAVVQGTLSVVQAVRRL